MFEITIYNLQCDKKKEIKNALSCSLQTEEEGNICILANHENIQGTIYSNSNIKIMRKESDEYPEQELDITAIKGIFNFKKNHLIIFYKEVNCND